MIGRDQAGPAFAPPLLGSGLHHLRVERCRLVQSRARADRWYFIVTFAVLLSTDRTISAYGALREWLQAADGTRLHAAHAIQVFLCACLGYTETAVVGPDVIDQVCAADQPLAGVELVCEGAAAVTRTGKTFTKVRWEKFQENLPAA